MRLSLLPLVFAFIIPLSACNNSTPNTSSSATSPAATSSAPASASNTAQSKAAANSDTSNWYTYSSQSGKYTAKFPEKPLEKQPSANPNSQSQQNQVQADEVAYVDKSNQRLYLINHIAIPVPAGKEAHKFDPEKALDGGRDQMLKGMKATLKSETKISQNGNPGREITMSLPNGVAAVTRVFVNPKELKAYRALIAAKDGNVNFPEAKFFLDSFSIN